MRKILKYIFLISTLCTLVSCKQEKIAKDIKISHNVEFNCIDIKISFSSLESKGFKLGDSLNFSFSNGVELKDVPYFNGYYCKKDEKVFCAYPTYEYPVLTKQFSNDLYVEYNLNENTTVTIFLNQEEKYKEIQNTLDLKYSKNRDEYSSDEEFANFRNIKCGNIKPNRLYRSASPVDNSYNRASYVSSLIGQYNIEHIFDLSNTSDKLAQYAQDQSTSEIWKNLYNQGRVYDVKVDANFTSENYYPKMKFLAEKMASFDGKFLFHCFEGKDRTGFVGILLEALCGATIKEITDDYFLSYTNFYHISEETNPTQISILKDLRLYEMTNLIVGSKVNGNATVQQLSNGAVNYLKTCGMSDENISKLIDKLTK